MDHTNKPRALPEGAFCGAGIEQLCLPSDFHNIGPRACENCKRLVEVNLMGTEITALLSATFAHCVALNCMWLPPRLTQIGKEVFLNCVVLQLQRFTPLDWGDIEQWVQAEHNAFFMCDKFEKPRWVELLSADGPDSDAFDEELYQEGPPRQTSSVVGKPVHTTVPVETCAQLRLWPHCKHSNLIDGEVRSLKSHCFGMLTDPVLTARG